MKNSPKHGRGRIGDRGGNARMNHLKIVEHGRDSGQMFDSPGRRALAFRRFLIFLLAAVLVLIGLASVVGARFF